MAHRSCSKVTAPRAAIPGFQQPPALWMAKTARTLLQRIYKKNIAFFVRFVNWFFANIVSILALSVIAYAMPPLPKGEALAVHTKFAVFPRAPPLRKDFPRAGGRWRVSDKRGNLSSTCETERASPSICYNFLFQPGNEPLHQCNAVEGGHQVEAVRIGCCRPCGLH